MDPFTLIVCVGLVIILMAMSGANGKNAGAWGFWIIAALLVIGFIGMQAMALSDQDQHQIGPVQIQVTRGVPRH